MRAPLCFAALIVFSIIGITSLSQLRYPGGFTACIIASTPSAAVATEPAFIASPFTHSQSLAGSAGICERYIARTFHPCRVNALPASLPIPPVAPSTSTFLLVGDIWQLPSCAEPIVDGFRNQSDDSKISIVEKRWPCSRESA